MAFVHPCFPQLEVSLVKVEKPFSLAFVISDFDIKISVKLQTILIVYHKQQAFNFVHISTGVSDNNSNCFFFFFRIASFCNNS